MSTPLRLINGKQVSNLLRDKNQQILNIVEQAYLANEHGLAVQPQSIFLKFPDRDKERIMGLAAFLGEPFNQAGIKWIASFPNNIAKNLERASAVYILNSLETGHPVAIIESSLISAKRTAASAVLSASLVVNDRNMITSIGIIGCGLINYETVQFLMAQFPSINTIKLYDLDFHRANKFRHVLARIKPEQNSEICTDYNSCFEGVNLVTLATSAVTPYIDLPCLDPNLIILHTSLRDLSPNMMLQSNNIVDDIDHACSANTSLHLASLSCDKEELINYTIGQLIQCKTKNKLNSSQPIIVSPFGMGILDLALASYIYQGAAESQIGTVVEDFLPHPWNHDLT